MKVRWVGLEQMHLTLKFLGDTPVDLIPEISQELGLELKRVSSFSFCLAGIGLFGQSSPRVIWVGVRDETRRLNMLKHRVEQVLAGYGFERDAKPLSPHVTLGRIKAVDSTIALGEKVDRYRAESFQEVKVSRIVWYKSELTPKGPIYRHVAVFPLKG